MIFSSLNFQETKLAICIILSGFGIISKIILNKFTNLE